MQALVLEQFNGPLASLPLPMPTAGAGQVLVRLAASGLNPLDLKIRAGAAAHARHPLPLVLGIDMAGIIQAVGSGVTTFKVGDAVYGMTGGVGGIQGSLAEVAAVDARLIAPTPANLSLREAAAIPLAFITAYSAIVDRAAVRSGQTVLIQGGAGGVGWLAVQLAQARGATVFATASERDHAQLANIGVTPIDFRSQSAEQYVRQHTAGAGFDVVIDTVGGSTLDASFAAVKHFGHVVSALGWGTHSLAPLSFREASYSGVFTLHPLLTGEYRDHQGEMLREATQLAESGKLVPRLDSHHFEFNSADAAYQRMAQGNGSGKLVVSITQ